MIEGAAAPRSIRFELRRGRAPVRTVCLFVLVAMALSTGCMTPLRQWADNGFKVGPNYRKPAAPVEIEWIDFQKDPRLKTSSPDTSAWWTVFNDPQLNRLVLAASQQNLTVRIAGTRILQAEAVRGFAAGTLFPQLRRLADIAAIKRARMWPTAHRFPISTKLTPASISRGNSISGASFAGASNRPTPPSTRRSRITTTCSSCCSRTWLRPTCRFASCRKNCGRFARTSASKGRA